MGKSCSYPVRQNNGIGPQNYDLAPHNCWIFCVIGLLEVVGDCTSSAPSTPTSSIPYPPDREPLHGTPGSGVGHTIFMVDF